MNRGYVAGLTVYVFGILLVLLSAFVGVALTLFGAVVASWGIYKTHLARF